MNYRELLDRVNGDFGTSLSVYKEKAGYLMLESQDGKTRGDLGNWDCGHSCPCKAAYVSINGWGYTLIDGLWYRVQDGRIGWRSNYPETDYGATLEDVPPEHSLW